MIARILSAAVVVVAIAAGVFLLLQPGKLEPIETPSPQSFDKDSVRRGAELAQIGNCNICHTAPGGELYAGGLALETPFGRVYSTNITPDRETGIGAWSEEAFIRSMRKGVDRAGRHLYPVFPYDHFTLVSDEDNRALYAFLMTQKAVRAEAAQNDLPFPLNWRPLLAGWKWLFLREGRYENDPAQSAEWNRGAYLAEGLGHCGACHTPRNALGAEERDRHFSGGEAEGWYAYAINRQSPAPVPWTVEALGFYLKHGWHEEHGISRGAMAPVTTNLASVADSDVRALAVYVASQMGDPRPEQKRRGHSALTKAGKPLPEGAVAAADSQTPPQQSEGAGAAIYASACASCHDGKRPLPYGGINLNLSTAISGPNPYNIINVVLYGLPPAAGEPSPIMPGFHDVLKDDQLAALLAYLRETFSEGEPWPDTMRNIEDVRSGRRNVVVRPTDGASGAPADPQARQTSW